MSAVRPARMLTEIRICHSVVKGLWLCLWELWHSVINTTQLLWLVIAKQKEKNQHLELSLNPGSSARKTSTLPTKGWFKLLSDNLWQSLIMISDDHWSVMMPMFPIVIIHYWCVTDVSQKHHWCMVHIAYTILIIIIPHLTYICMRQLNLEKKQQPWIRSHY